ncbi:MAG: tetratricopeptide repeat protein [Gammaproteobacteria bacterium]|nr:tetratricopeptide repeat protein [Gammaproteobacteria bacterium]
MKNNKNFILLAVSAILLNGCATLQKEDAYISSANPKTLTVNKPDEAAEAPLPVYELLLAELSLRRGDNQAAVDNYLQVLDKVNSSEISERAIKIAAHVNDLDSALEAAIKWQEAEPDNFKAFQVAGTLYFRKGNLDKSFEAFNQSIVIRGVKNRLGFISVMSILSREKKPEGVLFVAKRLADHYPENAYAQFMFASLAAKLNKPKESIDYLDKALKIENVVDAHGLKAKQLLKLGRRSEASESLALAVENNPENSDLRMTYARLLIDVKQYSKARAEFTKLLALSPNDASLLYTLGLLSLESNLLDDAERYLTKLLKTRHRRNESVYYLGRINEGKKDLKQAITFYQQVNGGDFEFDAQIRAVKLLAKMGELEKAISGLDKLKLTRSNHATLARIYLTEAAIYRSKGDFAKAMLVYDEAILRVPNNSDLLYARAITAEKVGRLDILEQDLLVILKSEPKNAQALNALGFSLLSDDTRLDDAYIYIKKALELSPNEPAIIDSMGWVEFKRGNFSQSELLLRKAYSIMKDGEIAAHLGEILWVQGKRVEAKQLLHSALKNVTGKKYVKEVMERLIP